MKLCSNYYHCYIFVCRILYVEHIYHVTKLDVLYSNIAYIIWSSNIIYSNPYPIKNTLVTN